MVYTLVVCPSFRNLEILTPHLYAVNFSGSSLQEFNLKLVPEESLSKAYSSTLLSFKFLGI
jgi:hypothetical protein